MSRFLAFLILLSLLVLPSPAAPLTAQAATTELFFTEYIEGSSNNKALEIYNDTGAAIDLGAGSYTVQMFFNGSASAGLTINLTGSVANGDVFVLAHSSANATILAQADQTNGSGWYNGDDAVILRKGAVVIDAIGQAGFDPGNEWGTGLVSTWDNTLRRKSTVCQGDSNATDAFDPALEWDGYATDTFDGLGAHSADCDPDPVYIINEADADQISTDSAEFIELYDGGVGDAALDGLVLVLYNGSNDLSYAAFDLDGLSTDADGYFVVCGNAATVPNCDLDVAPNTDMLQNGQDAVALYTGDATSFPNGTSVTFINLMDALVYDTDDADDPGLLVLLNPGQPQVNEGGRGDALSHSNQRCPNGSGGRRNTVTYDQYLPTPGTANTCGGVPEPFGTCGDPATAIHAIQGSGISSPEEGNLRVIEGIVVGSFQNPTTALGGFFLQEEDAQADTDPLTSEGIFVYASSVPVQMGDLVRVQGTVDEYFDLTELTNVINLSVCSSGNPAPASATITLPLAASSEWERWEGMTVAITQTLYATDHYNLGRYGEVELSVNARLTQPTDIVAPGAPALAFQALNDRSRIQLDDGSTVQNPLPLPPYLAPDNTLRLGDSIDALSGVLGYSFGSYEIHPLQAVTFSRHNPRPPAPAPLTGTLRVASANLLNFFTTLVDSGSICGPSGTLECRGADDAAEFTRQRDKLLAALSAINADIFGLVELENNATASAQSLVDGLNALLGAGTYAYINTGTIGSDAIKVGILYKPATVTPVGAFSVLDSSDDPNFLDTKNRPSLAQTFQDDNGEKFTVVVNHFKSKGSACTDVGDPDLGDGQGNCNLTRTRAATALVTWLGTDPTGSNDPDFLLLGDFNAYAMEDPVTAMKNAGYANLADVFLGAEDYSYVFDGQAGSLDHALTTPGLLEQVYGVSIWHTNADEPSALDYNDYNPPLLYQPDPFRAADHDPLVIALTPGVRSRLSLPLVVR